MATEAFVTTNFQQSTLDVIDQANAILEEYERDGLVLTLRQLYYQFVARNLIKNKPSEYDRLGDIISKGRLAGLIDWSMLEDRVRSLEGVTTWGAPGEILQAVANQYREDVWRTQKHRVEVWVEKDAVLGVIERACLALRVSYFACRGYSSQSAYYAAGKRLRAHALKGQKVVVLYMGDHDPSGVDMTRDVRERLSMFSGREIDVRRLALNMDQIEEYGPPPNAVKESDGRSAGYIAQFGDECWELDALEPHVLDRLVRDNVRKLIEPKKWKAAMDHEEGNRNLLERAAERWEEVRDFLTAP